MKYLVGRGEIKEAQWLADRMIDIAKQMDKKGEKGGWRFSYGVTFTDARSMSGGTAWVLKGLYTVALQTRDRAFLDYVNKKLVEVAFDQQVMDSADPRYGLFRAGFGIHHTRGPSNVQREEITTEHNWDYIEALREAYRAIHAIDPQAPLLGEIQKHHELAMQQSKTKLLLTPEIVRDQMKRLEKEGLLTPELRAQHEKVAQEIEQLPGKRRWATGGEAVKGIWVRSLSWAWDNEGWSPHGAYDPEVAYNELRNLEVRFLKKLQAKEFDHLPQGVNPEQEFIGLIFFTGDFADRHVAAHPNYERMIQPEATWSYIFRLVQFGYHTTDPAKKVWAYGLAQRLIDSMLRLSKIYDGAPYATKDIEVEVKRKEGDEEFKEKEGIFNTMLAVASNVHQGIVLENLLQGSAPATDYLNVLPLPQMTVNGKPAAWVVTEESPKRIQQPRPEKPETKEPTKESAPLEKARSAELPNRADVSDTGLAIVLPKELAGKWATAELKTDQFYPQGGIVEISEDGDVAFSARHEEGSENFPGWAKAKGRRISIYPNQEEARKKGQALLTIEIGKPDYRGKATATIIKGGLKEVPKSSRPAQAEPAPMPRKPAPTIEKPTESSEAGVKAEIKNFEETEITLKITGAPKGAVAVPFVRVADGPESYIEPYADERALHKIADDGTVTVTTVIRNDTGQFIPGKVDIVIFTSKKDGEQFLETYQAFQRSVTKGAIKPKPAAILKIDKEKKIKVSSRPQIVPSLLGTEPVLALVPSQSASGLEEKGYYRVGLLAGAVAGTALVLAPYSAYKYWSKRDAAPIAPAAQEAPVEPGVLPVQQAPLKPTPEKPVTPVEQAPAKPTTPVEQPPVKPAPVTSGNLLGPMKQWVQADPKRVFAAAMWGRAPEIAKVLDYPDFFEVLVEGGANAVFLSSGYEFIKLSEEQQKEIFQRAAKAGIKIIGFMDGDLPWLEDPEVKFARDRVYGPLFERIAELKPHELGLSIMPLLDLEMHTKAGWRGTVKDYEHYVRAASVLAQTAKEFNADYRQRYGKDVIFGFGRFEHGRYTSEKMLEAAGNLSLDISGHYVIGMTYWTHERILSRETEKFLARSKQEKGYSGYGVEFQTEGIVGGRDLTFHGKEKDAPGTTLKVWEAVPENRLLFYHYADPEQTYKVTRTLIGKEAGLEESDLSLGLSRKEVRKRVRKALGLIRAVEKTKRETLVLNNLTYFDLTKTRKFLSGRNLNLPSAVNELLHTVMYVATSNSFVIVPSPDQPGDDKSRMTVTIQPSFEASKNLLLAQLLTIITTLVGPNEEKNQGPVSAAGLEEEVSQLIADLGNQNASVRRQAAKSLGVIGARAEAAIPALKDVASQDPDLGVRLKTIHALGRIGSQEAMDPLIEGLSSTEWKVRRSAAMALGHAGSVAMDVFLRRARGTSSTISLTSLRGHVAVPSQAIPDLTAALSDPISQVRLAAARAIGSIGSLFNAESTISETRKVLFATMKTDPDASVRDMAVWALEHFTATTAGLEEAASIPAVLPGVTLYHGLIGPDGQVADYRTAPHLNTTRGRETTTVIDLDRGLAGLEEASISLANVQILLQSGVEIPSALVEVPSTPLPDLLAEAQSFLKQLPRQEDKSYVAFVKPELLESPDYDRWNTLFSQHGVIVFPTTPEIMQRLNQLSRSDWLLSLKGLIQSNTVGFVLGAGLEEQNTGRRVYFDA